MAAAYGSLPFKEQINFFLKKVPLPTAAWTDVYAAEHDVAFMVAGALKTELLADLRAALESAIAAGTTIQQFRNDFDAIVQKHGWAYQGGRNWRTRVIYDTNVRQSYNAGREAQMADPELRRRRPYGLYQHGDSVHPRPLHLEWNGTVLPLEHPWWQTHSPANGWGCKCKKFMLSARDVERRGLTVAAQAPPVEWQDKVVGVNGPSPRTVRVPKGIDPGFEYRPGENRGGRALEDYLTKAAHLPPEVAAAPLLEAISRRRLLQGLTQRYGEWLDAAPANTEALVVGAIRPQTLEGLLREGVAPPQTVGITIRGKEARHLARDTKTTRTTAAGQPVALAELDARRLPEILAQPKAVLYDRDDPALLYVFDPSDEGTAGRAGKVVVRVDFREKVRGGEGTTRKQVTNSVRTGGLVETYNLEAERYTTLEGTL